MGPSTIQSGATRLISFMDEGIINLNGKSLERILNVSRSVLELALLFNMPPELAEELRQIFCFGLRLPVLGRVVFRVDDASPGVTEFVEESEDPKL